MMMNSRWIYVKRPRSTVSRENYRLVEEPIKERLAKNEVLIANRFVSVDPYMRIPQRLASLFERQSVGKLLVRVGEV